MQLVFWVITASKGRYSIGFFTKPNVSVSFYPGTHNPEQSLLKSLEICIAIINNTGNSSNNTNNNMNSILAIILLITMIRIHTNCNTNNTNNNNMNV